jgi:hypothetical protein
MRGDPFLIAQLGHFRHSVFNVTLKLFRRRPTLRPLPEALNLLPEALKLFRRKHIIQPQPRHRLFITLPALWRVGSISDACGAQEGPAGRTDQDRSRHQGG